MTGLLCSHLLKQGHLEFAARIPESYKIIGTRQKAIFKDAFIDILPEKIRDASKRGFEVPISSWIRNELRGDVEKKLLNDIDIFRHIIDLDVIKTIVDEHMRHKNDYQMEIWTMYIFSKWYEINMV